MIFITCDILSYKYLTTDTSVLSSHPKNQMVDPKNIIIGIIHTELEIINRKKLSSDKRNALHHC